MTVVAVMVAVMVEAQAEDTVEATGVAATVAVGEAVGAAAATVAAATAVVQVEAAEAYEGAMEMWAALTGAEVAVVAPRAAVGSESLTA